MCVCTPITQSTVHECNASPTPQNTTALARSLSLMSPNYRIQYDIVLTTLRQTRPITPRVGLKCCICTSLYVWCGPRWGEKKKKKK